MTRTVAIAYILVSIYMIYRIGELSYEREQLHKEVQVCKEVNQSNKRLIDSMQVIMDTSWIIRKDTKEVINYLGLEFYER